VNTLEHSEWPRQRAAGLIAGVLLLLPAVMLAPAWRLWGLSALEDGLLYYFPQRAWFAQIVRGGEWPLWQHGTYGGFPVFSDPQTAMYYPFTWLFLILPSPWAYSLSISLHHSLAGWLMYRLCRGMGRTRQAAVLAGILWMLCGFMLAHREHLTMHHAAAWAPGVLWAWERWARTGRPLHWAVGVILVVLQILAGHVQIPLMTAPVALALVIAAAPRRRRMWLWCVAGFVVAGVICAVQILPALQLMANSADRRDYNATIWNSLAWRSLILFVFPMLFGQRTPNFYSVPWFGPSHQCEQTGYVTILGLALAAGGAIMLWRQDRRMRTWVAIAGVAMVLALGRNAYLYLVLMLIPLFDVLHTPARWLLVVDLGLIVLAAAGADALIRRMGSEDLFERVWRRWVPEGTSCLALVCMGLYGCIWYFTTGPTTRFGDPAVTLPFLLVVVTGLVIVRLSRSAGRIGYVVLVVLSIVDLATVAPFLDVSTRGVEAITRSSAAETLLEADYRPERGRVWTLPGDPYVRPRDCLMPATNLLDDIPTFNGYGPLLPQEHRELMRFEPWGVSDEAAGWLARPEVLARLGVGYVVLRDPNIPLEALGNGGEPVREPRANIEVYRNRVPAHPWYVTDRYVALQTESELFAALRSQRGEATPTCILRGGGPMPECKGTARILSQSIRTNQAEFLVESGGHTLLVWLNRWYPGWRATIDGRPVDIHRADGMGQAVSIPPGEQRGVFAFLPKILTSSALLSLLGLVLLPVLARFCVSR